MVHELLLLAKCAEWTGRLKKNEINNPFHFLKEVGMKVSFSAQVYGYTVVSILLKSQIV